MIIIKHNNHVAITASAIQMFGLYIEANTSRTNAVTVPVWEKNTRRDGIKLANGSTNHSIANNRSRHYSFTLCDQTRITVNLVSNKLTIEKERSISSRRLINTKQVFYLNRIVNLLMQNSKYNFIVIFGN